jgi:hypothetical protein
MDINNITIGSTGYRFLMSPSEVKSMGFERLLRGERVEVIFEFRELKLRTSRTPSCPEGKTVFEVEPDFREPLTDEEKGSAVPLQLRPDGDVEVVFPLPPL